MRYGVLILPEYKWAVAGELWKRVEDIGFDHAWTYDHLAWRTLKDSSWFSAIPTLTAVAMATQTIGIGMLVASPNFRHPVSFARELISLDDISSGRLTAGIGAGGAGWDTTMLGQPMLSQQEKTSRFEEFVVLLDKLLLNSETTWQGQYYTANDATTIPGCVQQPRIPFAIAATGLRGMKLAAKFGEIWVTTGDRSVKEPLDVASGVRAVDKQMKKLDKICYEVGRDPASLRRLVLFGPSLHIDSESEQAFSDAAGRYAEIGITDLVVHYPRQCEPYYANLKKFEQVMLNQLN